MSAISLSDILMIIVVPLFSILKTSIHLSTASSAVLRHLHRLEAAPAAIRVIPITVDQPLPVLATHQPLQVPLLDRRQVGCSDVAEELGLVDISHAVSASLAFYVYTAHAA